MKTFDAPLSPVEVDEAPAVHRAGRFALKPAYRLLLVLLLLALFLIWRGNQLGVQVEAVSPADGATEVSTRAAMQVTFDQKITAIGSGFSLSVSPPVSGTLRWEESAVAFVPAQALAPDTTYKVTLTADLKSQQGRPLQEPFTWQFHTRRPRVLYVAPDTSQNDQLFVISPEGGPATQLTQEKFGVWDYALSPDGATVIYAALREDAGSDLWQIAADGTNRQQLLACPDAACSGATPSPDGNRLVYERRNMLVEGAAPGPPHLWWLDPATGETVPVFEDKQWLGYGARWSPDSNWLSYVAPSQQGVQVYNINDGRKFLIPSQMGGLAVWSPQGDALLVTDIQRQEEGFAVHLLRADPTNGQLTDLSGQDANVEDSSPVWSPDGAWLALTRKVAGASMGKQIWLMRPDGSEARYLTNDTDINHGLPEWSPDSRYLLYQRYPLKELGTQPAVWLLDIQTERAQELVRPGNRPTWLP
ncbi:MAG TPA: Ig-like domain-containing protein [Anaerolineae bacterium]|nr:Ig-like domain-containing protein [Anaerolineae bacterium]